MLSWPRWSWGSVCYGRDATRLPSRRAVRCVFPSSVLVSGSAASAHHLWLHKCFWRAAPGDLLVAFTESNEFSMSCVYKPESDIVSLKMSFLVFLTKLSEQWGSLSSPHIPHAYISQKRDRVASWAWCAVADRAPTAVRLTVVRLTVRGGTCAHTDVFPFLWVTCKIRQSLLEADKGFLLPFSWNWRSLPSCLVCAASLLWCFKLETGF